MRMRARVELAWDKREGEKKKKEKNTERHLVPARIGSGCHRPAGTGTGSPRRPVHCARAAARVRTSPRRSAARTSPCGAGPRRGRACAATWTRAREQPSPEKPRPHEKRGQDEGQHS